MNEEEIQAAADELEAEGLIEIVIGDPVELPDEMLRYLILGVYRGVSLMEQFPVKIRGVVDNYDDKGDIESFTVITESGLKFTLHMTFDGQVEE